MQKTTNKRKDDNMPTPHIESNKEDILEIFENEWLYQEDYKTLLGDFYTK